MISFKSLNKRLLVSIASISATSTIFLGSTAFAAASNVSYAYHTNSKLSNGYLVSLVKGNSSEIEAANTNNSSRLLGIVTSSNSSLLAVNPSNETVQVALSGNVPVLVSTLDGNINVGDQISVSPISGVGMKAETGLTVVGLAQSSLNPHSANTTTEQVKDINGKKTNVSVGYITITTKIGSTASKDQSLNGLQQIVKSLTGHVISTARIIIAMIVTLVAIMALGALLYASIFSSIIALGRNPLAKFVIFRTLSGVVALAVLVAIVAIVVVNLLLR